MTVSPDEWHTPTVKQAWKDVCYPTSGKISKPARAAFKTVVGGGKKHFATRTPASQLTYICTKLQRSKLYAAVCGFMLSNISIARCAPSSMPRSRTSLAAFVALELLGDDQWHKAGESWQTCVLLPRCVIIDPNGKFALVVACQVYAARIWRLDRNDDHMLLDPTLPMEWVVATDITLWKVVPWEPFVAFDRDASQARYGCVTFRQSRPAVSALAWAVANHRLHKQQLKRFTKDHGAVDAEALLGGLLGDHEDRAFYMTLFLSGKQKEVPSDMFAEETKACLLASDPDNLSAFKPEARKLIGTTLGDDVAVGSDDEEAASQPEDDPMGAEEEEPDEAVKGPDKAVEERGLQPDGGEVLGPPMLALEAQEEGAPTRTGPAHSARVRAAAVHSNVDWAHSWLPPPPPDALKFGIHRIATAKKWTTFYDYPGAGSHLDGRIIGTHTLYFEIVVWLLPVLLNWPYHFNHALLQVPATSRSRDAGAGQKL